MTIEPNWSEEGRLLPTGKLEVIKCEVTVGAHVAACHSGCC